MSQHRAEGPTPNGGAYSIAYFMDAQGDPTIRERAYKVEIIEYDDKGDHIARTYGTCTPSMQFQVKNLLAKR